MTINSFIHSFDKYGWDSYMLDSRFGGFGEELI